MLKIVMMILTLAALLITGCGAGAAGSGSQAQKNNDVAAAAAGKRVVMKLSDGQAVLRLNDSKAAQNLYDMLPLQLSFKDFNRTEKISYPPRSLHEGLRPEGHRPIKGDLCIYAPWGNLCIFYRDYKMSDDLFYLGRVEQGMELLENKHSDFTVELSREQ